MKYYGPLLFLSALSVAACHSRPHSAETILPDTLRLQEGDVVFRRCTGLTSSIIVRRDTGGIFSHTGIVVDSAGHPMVIHAVPGEADYSGDPDRVKMTPPKRFFEKGYAVVGAVRHPLDRQAGHRAALKATEVYRRGTLFDHDYDDSDTTLMYCTELVVHAYRAAGIDLVGNERHEVSIPLMHVLCIMPSQIYHSPHFGKPIMFNPQ